MATKGVFGLPPEYESELDQARLRQELAKAMMGQYAQPVHGQMVGKHYVGANPLQYLANILGQTFQRQGIDAAQQEITGIKQRAATESQAERDKIIEALRGRINALPTDQAGPPQITPPNPLEAERLALGAKFPGNQALFEALSKNRMDLFKATAPAATNPSVVAAQGDPARLTGTVPIPPRPETIGGNEGVVTTEPKTGKEDFKYAPRPLIGSVSASASTGGKMAVAGVEHNLKQIDKSTPLAEAARVSLGTAQEALAALDQGAKTGLTQPFQQVVRKFMKDFGIETGPDAGDRLAAALKARVIQRAGGLGRQISDADREFLESASGSIMTDPTTLRRIIALDAVNDMTIIDRHNNLVKAGAQYPEVAPSLAGAMVNFNFRPDAVTAKMIDAVMRGESTFDAVPAPKPASLLPGKDGKPNPAGKPLTPAEQRELEELRAWRAGGAK